MKKQGSDTGYQLLQCVILAFAFGLPLTIAAAEPLAMLAIACWFVLMIRQRSFAFVRSPYFWPILLFGLFAMIGSWGGLRPSISLSKAHRLVFPLLIFAMAFAFQSSARKGWGRCQLSVALFIGAAVLLGLYDVIRVPVLVARGAELFDTGNMRDPQIYLVALCFLIAMCLAEPWSRKPWLIGTSAVITGLGLIVHFKRGAWIAFLMAAVVMGVVSRRRRVVLVVAACAVVALLLPPVQSRLELLKNEWREAQGGRFVLWTQVAPPMLADNPYGIGWRATEHEDLLEYSAHIQPGLDHLHNNLLQIALETGWAGLAIWVVWMATTVYVFLRAYYGRRKNDAVAWISLGGLGAFCGLMFNGVVEYNFGDTEVLLTLSYIMGLSLVVFARAQDEDQGPA